MTDEIDTAPVEEKKNGGKATTADAVYSARDLIPVGPTGATPMTFAQQVDYAKAMSQAAVTLPEHLRGNVGDCLAIIDMASRAGLSPYMVANKTYIQSGRLCFESQLFHAFAQASGLLHGELSVEYSGEGEERTCTISGYVKGDPRPKTHTSPPLKDVHPGTVEKDGKIFVRGSQLWNDKPDVQLFYDTSRDWVRMFCPRAVLGIYSREELEEYGPERARDVTPPLRTRLAGERPQTGEGWQEARLDDELARISPNEAIGTPSAPIAPKEPEEAPRPARPAARKRAKPSAPITGTRKPDKTRQKPSQGRRGRILSKAEVKAAADRAEKRSKGQKPVAEKQQRPLSAYGRTALAWIESIVDPDKAEARWQSEHDMRDEQKVAIAERLWLKGKLDEICEGIRAAL